MTPNQLKFLRIALLAYLVVAAISWSFSFNQIFSPRIAGQSNLERARDLADLIYYIAILFLAAILAVRKKQNTGNLLFAFLMTANSLSPVFPVMFDGIIYKIVAVANNMVFFTMLLKTFQFFPKVITREDIGQKIRWKPLRQIILLAHNRKSWYVFPLVSLVAMFSGLGTALLIIGVLILIMYLYINLSKDKSGRNKVLWLFWGIDIYFICLILDILFSAFNNEDVRFVSHITSIVSVIALLLALTMSFFFFDTFDTGVILKRTIINSFTLICIIFIYNVAEHYFLHWLSHKLHLSDALVSSVFSGILIMVVSPAHHKLMHYFETKLKGKHH
jgi:hypothetical protein